MAMYCVNTKPQVNGDHEVHVLTCDQLPASAHQKWLGDFADCHGAVKAAKAHYPTADGCKWCSRPCHTR